MTSEAAHTEYPDTIAASVQHEIVIKKSRFLTTLAPAASVADADAVIADVKRRYWDARHNCTAMVTGLRADQARSSDDGEPSGTAGAPMLAVLRRQNLTDVVAVVTRYFGGIKLGAGGLTRAYSGAVAETVTLAARRHRRLLTGVRLAVPFEEAGRAETVVRHVLTQHDGEFGDVAYTDEAVIGLWVPESAIASVTASLSASSAGAWRASIEGSRIVEN